MRARSMDNGNLLTPMAAEDAGGAIGDGTFGIEPDHPMGPAVRTGGSDQEAG